MKIAIITPAKGQLTETFIAAQIEHLKGDKIIYHGGKIPRYIDNSALPLDTSFLEKSSRKIARKLGNRVFSDDLAALHESLRKEKPDVILAQYGMTGADILPVVAKLQIPLVVHFHGYDASEKQLLANYRDRYLAMFQYASAIMAVSVKMAQMLEEIGAPKEKIVYNCYGPRDYFLQLNPSYSKPNFLSVGRFTAKKAHHIAILAFQKIADRFPEATLTIIGDGGMREVSEDLIRFFRLENRIILTGALPQEKILTYFENSIGFIQHSRTAPSGDMEGTPLSILESQAAALPVISTYHAGIPDVVIHEETGFLVEENEIETMTLYMIRLLQNPDMVHRMGDAARKRIQEKFTLQRHIKVLNQVLEQAVSNEKRPS